MPQKSIRFGIIGGGLMGKEFASAVGRWAHLAGHEAKPEIVAVSGRDAGRLGWFRDSFPSVKQIATDYRNLLRNAEVDAVYCAVPHDLHREMYVEIVEAGKHLLGEKPFGIDLAANEAILDTIRKRPELVVRCSSEFPYFPGAQRIIRYIREGRFGTILEVECGFLHSSDLDANKPIHWKRQAATNGKAGCMADLGLHVLHIPLRAGWTPANVRAILSNVTRQRKNSAGDWVACDTWDNATLLCEVAQGDTAFPLTAKFQRMAPGEANTWYLTIKGTQFSASFTTKHPKTLNTLRYEAGSPQVWQSEDLGYETIYKTVTGGIFEFGFCDAMLQMVAAFCDQVVRGNAVELPFGCATPGETQLSHKVFQAALASHRDRQVVELG